MSVDESLSGTLVAPTARIFTPHNLVALLLRPRDYFARGAVLGDHAGLLISALLVGIANASERIDQNLVKADFKAKTDSFTSWAVSSWSAYWFTVLTLGVISGTITWYLRGWWYRKRLEWSGASDVAPEDARGIATLQNLVYVLPALAWTVWQTLVHPNYLAAWEASDIGGLVILVFLFWSCWTSYCAATTVYTLNQNKARLWFLILPAVFYFLVMGVYTTLYALLT